MNIANTILFFVSGDWEVKIEGADYRPKNNQFCILRRLETCVLVPLSYPCSMYRISYSAYYFQIIDPSNSFNIPFDKRSLGTGNLYNIDEAEIIRFYKNIDRIINKTDENDQRLAMIITLIDLLTEICEHYSEDPDDIRAPQIREVLDYVNEHYCEDIGIEDLTQKLYMSRSQIERVMKSSTGYSTWNYILKKRISYATQLLHQGMGNKKVAEATGFHDYSTFYKAYVKITHKTPTVQHPTLDNDPLLKSFYTLNRFTAIEPDIDNDLNDPEGGNDHVI